MADFIYKRGDELPGLNLPWEYEVSPKVYEPLDLSSGYTFPVVKLTSRSGTVVSPTPTVTGYDGGVTVDWAVNDLDITPDVYTLTLTARETATTKDRTHNERNPLTIEIK